MILIVPYRNREEHLEAFKAHYKDFDILVVEQLDDKPFNRGKLLNIGYDYMSENYNTFVFHDVDMLSSSNYDRAIIEHVTHFATQCSQFGYKMPYSNYCGGILAMSDEAFEKCNGYPNECWGWGAEDDILYERIKKAGYYIWRYPNKVESLKHEVNIDSDLRIANTQLLRKEQATKNILYDGLGNLSYKIKSAHKDGRVEHIKVII